jgi:hypothetical protein
VSQVAIIALLAYLYGIWYRMNPEKEVELTSAEETAGNDSEASPLKSSCDKILNSTYDDILAFLREVSSECTPEVEFDILKYFRKWEVSFHVICLVCNNSYVKLYANFLIFL